MMSTEIARREGNGVDVFHGWTAPALREQVARERELREVIVEYYRSCMVRNHHYYQINDDQKAKPALSKEGALNLCSLFKVRAEPDPPTEIWHPDGHYTVRYRTRLVSLTTGELVAVGDGMCSTRESKYAYRYAARICPECGKPAIIKGREEYGGGWICFKRKEGCGAKFRDGDASIEAQVTGRIPNEDLADQENTVLKMSEKRSLVDGALKLPLASELFIQDLEEHISHRQEESSEVIMNEERITSKHGTTQPTPVNGDLIIPKGLPCEGMKLSALRPSQVEMVLRKAEVLRQTQGEKWESWVQVLQAHKAGKPVVSQPQQHHDEMVDASGADPEDNVPDSTPPEAPESPQDDARGEGDGSVAPHEDRAAVEPAGPSDTDTNDQLLNQVPPEPEVDEDGEVTTKSMRLLIKRANKLGTRHVLQGLAEKSPAMSSSQWKDAWEILGKHR